MNLSGWFGTLTTLMGLAFLTGCSQLGYYAHCTQGHLALLADRTPITRLLSDPATPAELVEQLRDVSCIRDFASNQLHLPDNDSYRSYSDLQRPYVTWNVVATKEFDLQPLRWCFPFAGCLTYQGFFEQARAESFAAELRRLGHDTYVYGIAAYSTLGWFDDPVLNTFLEQSSAGQAGIIFHELAHQQLFLENDTSFSEGFATAVEQLGVEQWLARNGSPEEVADYQRQLQQEEDFTRLIEQLREKLAALYCQPLCSTCKRQAKAGLLASFTTEYELWKRQWDNDAGYDLWVTSQLNNAKLASVNTYHQLVPGFRALFSVQNSDFQLFYRAAKQLSELPESERSTWLLKLGDKFLSNQR